MTYYTAGWSEDSSSRSHSPSCRPDPEVQVFTDQTMPVSPARNENENRVKSPTKRNRCNRSNIV
jgi:hypothetical protein